MRLHSNYFPNIGGLFHKDAYLLCGGVYGRISQEDVAKHPPGLKLIFFRLPTCHRLHTLIGQQEACVLKGGECASTYMASQILAKSTASDTADGDRSGNRKTLMTYPTMSGSSE